jgi:acetyl-CoA C-acetyltransferase
MVHVDLYACFPSIVQLSARHLGFEITRPLTVTGGLGFAGAAIGNAAGQSIAAMVPLVRADGSGFVHANGGHATKHAFGVYRNTPPSHFAMERCTVDLGARPELDADFSGGVTVEAATVVFDREGPTHLLAAVQAPDGRRGWGRSTNEDDMVEAMTQGVAGRTAHRDASGSLRL